MDNSISKKYAREFHFSKPVVYKNKIKIYPVKYEYYYEFNIGIQSLLYDTMDYPNSEYALLPRLYFLSSVIPHSDDEEWCKTNDTIVQLFNCWNILLDLVFKENTFSWVYQNNHYILRIFVDKMNTETYDSAIETLYNGNMLSEIQVNNLIEIDDNLSECFDDCDTMGFYNDIEKNFIKIIQSKELYVDNFKNNTDYVDISSKKFEEIRKIILEQNSIEYSDEFIHNDIKNFIDEEDKRNNDSDMFTLEDIMDAVMLEQNIYKEDIISQMYIRRVNRLFSKIMKRDNWRIQKTGEMSGMVTFKEPIEFWLSNRKESKLKQYFKELK